MRSSASLSRSSLSQHLARRRNSATARRQGPARASVPAMLALVLLSAAGLAVSTLRAAPLPTVPARAAPASASAAKPIPGIGTPLEPGELAGMRSIPPDGAGLPPGSGSVADGARIYAQACASCHGGALQGQKAIGAPPLIGGRGTLSETPGTAAAAKPLKTVESYWPYATTLFDYIGRAMPMNAPGSLSAPQIYAVSAFILAKAGIVPETAVLDARTLPQIRMPNRDGFFRAAYGHGVEPPG